MLQVGNIFNQAWFVPRCEGIVLARAGKFIFSVRGSSWFFLYGRIKLPVRTVPEQCLSNIGPFIMLCFLEFLPGVCGTRTVAVCSLVIFLFSCGMNLFGEKLIIIALVRSRALLWHEVCSCRLALSLGVIIIIIFYFCWYGREPYCGTKSARVV